MFKKCLQVGGLGSRAVVTDQAEYDVEGVTRSEMNISLPSTVVFTLTISLATFVSGCSHLSMSTTTPAKDSSIWWSNAFFFVGVHLAAAYGVYVRPPQLVSWQILAMTVVLWQLASFG